MSFTEFAPQPILQPDIKCFWTLEESSEIYNSESIVPDSYVELVINCGAPLFLIEEDGRQTELPRIFLKGLQKKPIRLHVTGLAQLIGVRLYPWMVRPLLDIQMHNSPIMALERHQRLGSAINAALRCGDYPEAIDTLRQFTEDKRCAAPPLMTVLQTAGDLLYASQGQIRMLDLASQCSLSPSQLERQFKQSIGLTPKMFARLVRFEFIRDTLFQTPQRSLLDLVYDFGYTDQAHFTHDFKAFANRSPGAFVAKALQEAEFLQSS